jgi:hypothetical protein
MKSTPAICGDHLVPISECNCLDYLKEIREFSRTADTTNERERENEMSEKEIMCVYCKQPLQDLHAISGRKIDPHYATKDQDFGCDNNPINTEEGVGDHEPNLEKYYGVRV